MAQVTVEVFQGGERIATVERPLRSLSGKPAVKYKKKLWPLIAGKRIQIGPISQERPSSATETLPKSCATQELAKPAAITELKDDKQQRGVIEAPSDARLLVDAGPGTGKTAVACARVAWLVNQCDCLPGRIWLISFTRTAVREIRNRISAYLKDDESAWAVKVATLDSRAWAIHSGFDEGSKLFGSYDENIEKVLELVRSDPGVEEYLERIDHLIVDEAQDIGGVRADLVLAIVEKLRPDCGVTIFTDDAQAIYGFTEDDSGGGSKGRETLPQLVRKRPYDPAFQETRLTTIYRTKSPGLLKIFGDIRAAVLNPAPEPERKRGDVRKGIRTAADGTVATIDQQNLSQRSEVLVLYRRRVDVLLASSFLCSAQVAHRIRMSGLPVCIQPWVAAALAEHVPPQLSQVEFCNLWSSHISGTPLEVLSPEEAWKRLVAIAGIDGETIDMRSLRARLSRQQPPADFCTAEFGERGPVVGTIHASKGREADAVHLMLSNDETEKANEKVDHEEEARVDFVGATRARFHFKVGSGYRQWATHLEQSKRVYSRMTHGEKAFAQVEIGREGDIAAEGISGRKYFNNPEDVRVAQNRLLEGLGKLVSAYCVCNPSLGFAFELRREQGGDLLAVMGSQLNSDLFSIGNSLGLGRRRPPEWIKHIWIVGVRSLIVPAESPQAEALHMPWRETGIMLAPLVLGYTKVFFPYVRRS